MTRDSGARRAARDPGDRVRLDFFFCLDRDPRTIQSVPGAGGVALVTGGFFNGARLLLAWSKAQEERDQIINFQD